jgi:hypothetical protein
MNKIVLVAASLALAFNAGAKTKTKPTNIVPDSTAQVAGNTTPRSQAPAATSVPTAPLASSWSSFGGQTHEVDVNLSRAEIHSYKLGDSSYTDINLAAAYHHYLGKNNLQVGGEGGLMSFPDGTSSKTLIALMGIVTYNIDSDLINSVYANAGLGLYPAYDKSNFKYDSKFSFMFNVGKRFNLWNHVNYKPYFRLMKRGDMDMEFYIEALSFSFMY